MKVTMLAMCALVLALVAVPLVNADDIRGTIVKFEQPAQVVVLDDGRMFQIRRETVMMIDSKPVTVTQLEPGRVIILRSAVPVTFKDGKYIIIEEKSPSALPR